MFERKFRRRARPLYVIGEGITRTPPAPSCITIANAPSHGGCRGDGKDKCRHIAFPTAGGRGRSVSRTPVGHIGREKNEDARSIPKGEVEVGEDLLICARLEFADETGSTAGRCFRAAGTSKTATASRGLCLTGTQSRWG